MQKQVRVVVDAMGGDNAPEEIVKGAVEAAASREDIQIIFTGREEVIKQELAKYEYPADRVSIVNATEVIETAEPPVNAIRKKKDSSIVVGMNLVKNKEADAFVSSRKHWRRSGRRPGDCRKNQGSGTPAFGTADSHEDRCGASGGLRSQCGCQIQSSGAVCKDGFHLYGTCGWSEESQSWDCQHRCRRREGKRPCKRDLPSAESSVTTSTSSAASKPGTFRQVCAM